MTKYGAALLLAGALCVSALWLAKPARAAAVDGAVAGLVQDPRGNPLVGAVVSLTGVDGRRLGEVKTDFEGRFRLTRLFPGEYSLDVALSHFKPVLQRAVRVQSGRSTYLQVTLGSIFHNLRLHYGGTGEVRDMSDNWKWMLRMNAASRPALRFTDSEDLYQRETRKLSAKLSGTFSDTKVYAEVAGGASRSTALANESDLGTTVAVATSLFGNHDLMVSGNFGYGMESGRPASAFRASYSPETARGTPEVSMTVRQLQSPVVAGRALFGPQGAQNAPELQTLSLAFDDRAKIGPITEFEYGFQYDSISFVNRMQFVSPYGRLVVRPNERREIYARFASGIPRAASDQSSEMADLRRQVSSLGLFPRLSMRDGQTRVQRTRHLELGLREDFGNNLVEAAVFTDAIRDLALTASVAGGQFGDGNILPNLFGSQSSLNGGEFEVKGYRVSYARKLGERLQAAIGYTRTGTIAPGSQQLSGDDIAALRQAIETEGAHIILASISLEVPTTKTQVVSSYQWADVAAVIAPDAYNDFASRSDPGWNLVIRQPIPVDLALPGKLEVSADMRNLLRSGYVPMTSADGRALMLLQAIRSYRGALSFVF